MRRVAFALGLILICSSDAEAQKIVIDAGHGGSDPGAVGNGLEEADVNLDVVLRFRDLLVADTADSAGGGSWTVYLTRDSDTAVSLASRTSYADSVGANRFMSIHSNAFTSSSANGTETFAYSEGGQSAALRNLVQEEMIAAWGLTNRGNKTANFYVLRETSMPAELHELAFITNASDAQKLGSPTERQRAAEAHLMALQRHYGITPYLPGSSPEPPPPVPTAGNIEGVVTGPGGPVIGAEVSLDGAFATATDAGGGYVLPDVAVGEHVLGVWADGFMPADAIAMVGGGETAQVDFLLDGDEGDDEDPPDGDTDPDELDDEDPSGDPPSEFGHGDIFGGCAVAGRSRGTGGAAWLLVLVIALAVRRRA